MPEDKMAKRRKDGGSPVLLRDLTPKKEVSGGVGKLLFGERRDPADDSPNRTTKAESSKRVDNRETRVK